MSLQEKIYFKSPVWLQNAMVSVYGAQLWYRRYAGKHDEYLKQLHIMGKYTPQQIQEYQNQEFLKVVRHAFEQVPFYRNLSKETGLFANDFKSLDDITKLPIIEKEMVRQDPLQFCAQNYFKKKYVILKTSGSTGKPLPVYCDFDSRRKHYAFWSRLRNLYGVASVSKRATFFGKIVQLPDNDRPPFWRYDIAQKNLLFSSYHMSNQNLEAYCLKLKKYNPAEILGYPSSILTLARFVIEHNITSIRPKVVFTTAETLFSHHKKIIEQAFNTPVVSQYGCVEMAVFAHQCENDVFHSHPEHGYFELTYNEFEEKEILCTGFVNRMMPLMRYRLGDVLDEPVRKCTHIYNLPALGSVRGRTDDIITTPSGKQIGRMNTLFCAVDGIIESQVIQEKKDLLRVLIVVDEKFNDDHLNNLKSEISKRIGTEMVFSIQIVDAIPKAANGKYKHVIKDIKDVS
jgi:phenylacetate-CoA ligase